MLTREQILAASDIVYKIVDVPEWKDTVRVKSLSGTEVDIYQQGLFEGYGETKKINLVNGNARLCTLGIVDEQGKRLFTDDDVAAIAAHNGSILEKIAKTIRQLSGMDAIEDLAKNSVSGQSESSISS